MDKNTILDYVTKTPGNTNRAVLGSMLDNISGSSSDNMAILPKLTVTLSIDNIEHIDLYEITGAVEINNGIVTKPTFNPPQTSQVWEGYITPWVGDDLFWSAQICLVEESQEGYYECTISNMVNCTEDSYSPGAGIVIITDATKPASCTVNAVYTYR